MTILIVIILNLVEAFSQVNLNWYACYNGEANDRDIPTAICVDDSGYVYVTGTGSIGISGNYEFITIKYNLDGEIVWVKKYYGQTSGSYVSKDVKIDHLGNVYITGTITTIKYDQKGNQLWLQQMPPFTEGTKIEIIDNTEIVIAGTSLDDYILFKYNEFGALQWQRLYNGTAQYRDNLRDMTIDSKNNIIVTGWSHGSGTHWDYATVKYSPDGDSLWVKRYNGLSSLFPGDYAYAVTVDGEDNVYVTGSSDGSDSINNSAQCLTIAYSPEGDTLWIHRYAGIGYAGYDVVYSNGYIYVVARSNGIEDVILKYDKVGNLLWTRSYSSNHLFANVPPGIKSDSGGNIYLRTINWNSTILRSDFVLLKYKPDGTRLWEYNYPGQGNNTSNAARDFVLNRFNDIYLTGSSQGWVCSGGDLDFLTLKISQDKVGINYNPEIILSYRLFQNYPNPFNPRTIINYQLPMFNFVSLKVYDVLGNEVAALVNEKQNAGAYSVEFDGSGFSSGVYFYRIEAGDFAETKRMVFLK